MLKLLLKHGGADGNGTDSAGQPALHRAMKYGSVGIVRLLVEVGATIDGHKDGYPSPLHVACGFDRFSLDIKSCDVGKASALLGHRASVNLGGDEGNTPLCYAAENRSAEMVGLLKAGADESIINDHGETPADRVESINLDHSRYEELSKPVLRLLDGVPADRAWRRGASWCFVAPFRTRHHWLLRGPAQSSRGRPRDAQLLVAVVVERGLVMN